MYRSPHNNLLHALETAPPDTREWLHMTVAAELATELDTIEQEYRKLGTGGRLMMDGTRSVDELAKAGT